MTKEDYAKLVMDALFAVAPDAAGSHIMPDETFREQFEIDSMDFLNFIIGLSKATGLPIPERDYSQLQTLEACIDYLQRRMEA